MLTPGSRTDQPLNQSATFGFQPASNNQSEFTHTTYRSARLSPLQKFDTLIRDSNKKVGSEFPFASRKPKKFSKLNDFPEVIEEDKKEEEQVSYPIPHN